jgi:hypothetical protein
MNLQIACISATLLLTMQHSAMPKGMSHEEHMKQMEKDDALKKRGADAMGFDQDVTAHHFRLTPAGGSIEVTVKDDADRATLARIRTHLKSIAEDFSRGDFGKPFQTHAEVPPGVSVMQKYARVISYRYQEVPHGGIVQIRSADSRALHGLHDFLRYQIAEHRTGDDIRPER